MNESTTPPLHDASNESTAQRRSQLLHEQRQLWRRGERIQVEAFLAKQRSLQSDEDGLLDLVYNEVLLRQEQGEAPALEDYQARFPQLAQQLRLLFEVDRGLGDNASAEPDETVSGGGRAAKPWDATSSICIPGFDIIAQLGRGGMGVVFQARQIALDRIVALKVIRAGGLADAEDVRRFRIEALAAARLQHPHIAQVFDVAEHEGRPYLVLEHVAGGSLDKFLSGRPLPIEDAARLIEILARAIHFAHECGVVHRDLKPANILIEGEPPAGSGRDLQADSARRPWHREQLLPKITDFGLAKLMDAEAAKTQTGHILGTPAYMSPEQAAGHAADVGPATDIYALGAILYECLTGHPPFQGQSPLDTLAMVIHQEPVSPRQVRPQVQRDLETVCLKCLRKEPGQRYATALALAEDLERFREHRPVLARPVRLWSRGLRWVRRHPMPAAFVGLCLALLMAASIGAWLVHEKRSSTVRAVEAALRESSALRHERKWSAAALAARTGEELLDQGLFDEPQLRQRVGEQLAELQLAGTLEKIQLRKCQLEPERHELRPSGGTQDYEQAFAKFGLTPYEAEPEQVGQRIFTRAPAIREQLVTALDDWVAALGPQADASRLDWLERVLAKADPDDAWRRQFRQARARQDEDALRQLAKVAAVDQQPGSAVLSLAESLVAQGAANEAVSLLRRAQQRLPSDFWINNRLASYCVALQPPAMEEALRCAYVAMALRPSEPGAHFCVGYLLQRLNHTDEAIAAFRRAAELEPSYAQALVFLGDALTKTGDWPKAEAAYRQALRHTPGRLSTIDNLSFVLFQRGKFDAAVAVQQEAVRLAPTSLKYRNSLAARLVSAGRRDEAIQVLRQIIADDPTFVPAYANLGFLLHVSDQPEEALSMLQTGLRLRPDQPAALANMGRTLNKLGRPDEAMQQWREALRQQPNFVDAQILLGNAYERGRQYEAALALYYRAVACEPNNPDAQCKLGLLLLKLGPTVEAWDHLRIGHQLGSRTPSWNRPSTDWLHTAERQLSLSR